MKYLYFVSFIVYRPEEQAVMTNVCCETKEPLDNVAAFTSLEYQLLTNLNREKFKTDCIKILNFQLLRTESGVEEVTTQ